MINKAGKDQWRVEKETDSAGEGGNGEIIPLYHIWTKEQTLALYESDQEALQEVCDAHNAALAAERAKLKTLKSKWESSLSSIEDYPETQYGRGLGIQECIKDLDEINK
jgi:hypothetical protein